VKTVRDIQTLRGMTQSWHQDGDSIALVPTMGSLHPGHISLVRLAHEYAERVIVSVFVNPTQFGPNEDYKSYPRSLDNDRRRVSRAGVDVLFAPGNEEIYPFGEDAMTRVSVPDLSTVLCGDSRPGHFDGVTSVVSRLFNIIQPDVAVFGQKDYQQLVIIRRMVADLHLPIKILAGQTQRQDDGLALSSRNRYLSDAERSVAPQLHGTLRRCGDQIMSGNRNFASLEAEARAQLEASGFEVDYFTVRKAGDLSSPDSDSRYLVILAAARLGEARLIDNILIEAQEQMRSTGT
jgi:pantoate--beta-alanine ligase